MLNKNTYRFIITLCIVIILSSCGKKNRESNTKQNAVSVRSIYKDQLKIEYSKSFEIEYLDSSKVVRVFSPDEKRTLIYQYLLLSKGVAQPEGYEDFQIIHTPVNSVITLSTLYIGFLEKINSLDKIIAVDEFKYINSSTVWQKIKEGKISEVGPTTNVNIEKVLDLNPDLLFTYGNGNPKLDGHLKLMQTGIKVASSTSHFENTPLARAEWIKFVAVFFDKEKEANEVFNKLVKDYNKLVNLTREVKDKPTVFTQAMYGGIWFTPGGKSYIATQLKDAGADYMWKDDSTTGSLHLTYEQVYEKAYDADIWIHVHLWNKISDALESDSRNSKFKAYKTKNIYNYNALLNEFGGNEYFETGVINADVVLADLIKIFHPDLLPGHKLKYYKKLLDE